MTLAPIKARVFLDRSCNEWVAQTVFTDDQPQGITGRRGTAPSQPDALQLAKVQREELEQLLLDDVHASRASRRAERCAECGEIVPEGMAHWKLSEDPCMILPADQIDADVAEDTYTMEATA